MSTEDNELDPRIQIELENLNSATDEINKLEIELEEANSTFRILLNESTRRLKLSSKKLGNCIEKARPYHDACEKARAAQIECQKAAVKFQRANEIHAAAKETVALAEDRFLSNSHEWQFDNAWQEMLNHATQKVMDAEKQKADCHAEHQRQTKIFHAAEQKVQQLEERFRRSIAKSRPYFEEKQIFQDQLGTQKNRIQELQAQVQAAKSTYSTSLRNLERISDDIHRQRGDFQPPGPREPGVGAELNTPTTPTVTLALPDFQLELEKCDYASMASSQMSLGTTTSSITTPLANDMEDYDAEECVSDYADNGELTGIVAERDLEALRQKVKILAVRPIEGGDGEQQQNDVWEHELNATVNKLDHLMMLKECALKQKSKQQQQQQKQQHHHHNIRPNAMDGAEAPAQINDIDDRNMREDVSEMIVLGKGPIIKITSASDVVITSLPATPEHVMQPLKKLQKLAPLPSVNSSMRELPLLAQLSHDITDSGAVGALSSNNNKQRRRSLE